MSVPTAIPLMTYRNGSKTLSKRAWGKLCLEEHGRSNLFTVPAAAGV